MFKWIRGGACISVDVNGNLCQEEEGEVDVEVEVKREGWIFCLIATRIAILFLRGHFSEKMVYVEMVAWGW